MCYSPVSCLTTRWNSTHITDALHEASTHVVRGGAWLGRKVKHYAVDPANTYCLKPAMEGIHKIGVYIRDHQKSAVANIVAWGLILIFCGGVHGFKAVSLPMFIGIGPGILGGLLIGLIAYKSFHHQHEGRIWTHLKNELRAIPEWTRTLLLAIMASGYLMACCQMPYATGALAGIFLGSLLSYFSAAYDPTQPKVIRDIPSEVRLLQTQCAALQATFDQSERAHQRSLEELKELHQTDIRALKTDMDDFKQSICDTQAATARQLCNAQEQAIERLRPKPPVYSPLLPEKIISLSAPVETHASTS